MPIFEIEGPDGKAYELDGPSMDWAISAFKGSVGPTKATKSKTTSESAADMLVRFATGGAGIKHGLEKAGEHAKGLMTGEIPPTPENVVPAASMALGASPIRLGLGGAVQAVKAEPRLATTIEELERAGTEAVARPTGAVVPQAEAGGIVRRALQEDIAKPPPPPKYRRADEWPFQSGPAKVPVDVPIGGPESVPGPARTIGKKSSWVLEENVINHVIRMAESKGVGSDLAALSHIKKVVPEADWGSVQGAALARMGQTGGRMLEPGPVGFDPIRMLESYRDMSPAGKGLLFGESSKAGMRVHLDSLIEDMARIDKLRIPTTPLEALAEAMGIPVPIKYMAEPKTAAPLAQWSKAFTRLFGEGRGPAAVASFKIATDNLENSLGVPIDRDKLVRAMPEVPRAEEKKGTVYERGFASMIGGLGHMRRQLPYEKMRQSTNVIDLSGAKPPEFSLADLQAGRFTPNEEYGGRMQRGVPLDLMNMDAGLSDLLYLSARRR